MLHEFAVEPRLLRTLSEFRFYTSQFGFDRGRLIVQFPKKWKRMVYESLSDCREIERHTIVEQLNRLDDRMIRRQGSCWDPNQGWLANAETEHSRIPFRAILAEFAERGHPAVITGDSIDDTLDANLLPETDPRKLWKVDRSRTIKRTAPIMADAIDAFLKHADQLRFVDKYFGPENLRYRIPFQEFFTRLHARPNGIMPSELEVHCAQRSDFSFFRQQCELHLAGFLPAGVRVHFYRWSEQDLHNRYVFTELGGIAFLEGLDQYSGSGREEDVVSLLDRDVVRRLMHDYSKGTSPFTLVDECEITGTSQQRPPLRT